MRRSVVVTHRIETARWRSGALRIAVLSDVHVVDPWTSLRFLSTIVDKINALSPDLILLPGDFLADPKLLGRRASAGEIVEVLENLSARFGVHATLGNHDWNDCSLAKSTNLARNSVAEALEASDIQYYANQARQVGSFWVAGTDSSQSVGTARNPVPRHDLSAAMAEIPDGANVILMAHEPDLWVAERPNVALTVSGHTHGGQMILGNWRPLTPSRYGAQVAHGLYQDGDRALVVSGGLGFTAVPVRIGVPPEITLVELSGPT